MVVLANHHYIDSETHRETFLNGSEFSLHRFARMLVKLLSMQRNPRCFLMDLTYSALKMCRENHAPRGAQWMYRHRTGTEVGNFAHVH